jgi:hypothetical protein
MIQTEQESIPIEHGLNQTYQQPKTPTPKVFNINEII